MRSPRRVAVRRQRSPVVGKPVRRSTAPILDSSGRDRIMSTPWRNRLSKVKSGSRARERRARLGVEALEQRLALSVNANLVNGQLLVTDTSAAETATLDHSGSFTFVNGQGFADSLI